MFQNLKKFVGLGVLFVYDETLNSNTTTYRLYAHGKWGAWQKLEDPLFDAYVSYGNISALMHSRLDKKLIARLVRENQNIGKYAVHQTSAMNAFLNHFRYAHQHPIQSDSVALVVTQRKFKNTADQTVINLKFKL